mgnify:CR=1 FL=1
MLGDFEQPLARVHREGRAHPENPFGSGSPPGTAGGEKNCMSVSCAAGARSAVALSTAARINPHG